MNYLEELKVWSDNTRIPLEITYAPSNIPATRWLIASPIRQSAGQSLEDAAKGFLAEVFVKYKYGYLYEIVPNSTSKLVRFHEQDGKYYLAVTTRGSNPLNLYHIPEGTEYPSRKVLATDLADVLVAAFPSLREVRQCQK